MRRSICSPFVLCLFATTLTAADRPEGKMFATRSVVYARHGMVACSHPLAAQIGVEDGA